MPSVRLYILAQSHSMQLRNLHPPFAHEPASDARLVTDEKERVRKPSRPLLQSPDLLRLRLRLALSHAPLLVEIARPDHFFVALAHRRAAGEASRCDAIMGTFDCCT